MSPLLPDVRAGFFEFTRQFEGDVPYMYLDVLGFVTTGVGNLVDPMFATLSLPWRRVSGELADANEVRAEWYRVKSMPKALVFTHYHSATGLHLDDAAIAALVGSKVEAFATELTRHFAAFAAFPAEAQTAILSMAWAMGAGFPLTWPRFSASVRARDWRACAANCAIRSEGNAGVIPRNRANAALFLAAADVRATPLDGVLPVDATEPSA